MSDWQLDRLPGDVRQEAENAAQRDGLPLHRWLGKLIRETCADEGVPPGRELVRHAANGSAGNGHRHQPVVPPRPMVEAIRISPEVRAAEPARPAERQAAAAPTSNFQRNGNGRDTPIATAPIAPAAAPPVARPREPVRTPEPPRVQEPPRQPSRVAPVAREAAPPTAPPVSPPAPTPSAQPPFVRLSTISPLFTASSSNAASAPRGMPPTPPNPPTSTPSRFAAEPRPAPRREPMVAPTSPTAQPASAAPVASSATTASPSAAQRAEDRLGALSKLVQSLRRNELSPIGEARLFLKLMTENMASIGDITIVTGRTKEQVGRSLRLLGLSDRLRDLIDRGALSREQAFALLDADDPDAANPVVSASSGHRTP